MLYLPNTTDANITILILWTIIKVLFCFVKAFSQVPSVEYFKKVSKFICNQYLSYLYIPSESVWLAY